MIVVLLLLSASCFFFAALFVSTKHTMDYVFCNSTVSAWEAKLLSPPKLVELVEAPSLSSAVSVLEGTEYHQLAKEFSSGVDDFRILEKSLHEHAVRKFGELLRLVPDEAKPVIEKILEWRDLWNFKLVVSAIHHGVPKEERVKELLPSPVHPPERLQLLASAESMEQLVEFLRGSDYEASLVEALPEYKKYGLPILWATLERAYFQVLWSKAVQMKTHRNVFTKLVGYLIDSVNVKAILRLKAAGVPEPEIEKYLVIPSNELSERMLRALITAEDVRSAVHAIRITQVGQVLSAGLQEIESEGVGAVERLLDNGYLELAKRLELMSQFSVAPVLSYIAQKEWEFRELRKCLRLKADGFAPQEMRKILRMR